MKKFYFDEPVKSRQSRHSCESRSPGIVPPKAGNHSKNLDSRSLLKTCRDRFCGNDEIGVKRTFYDSTNLGVILNERKKNFKGNDSKLVPDCSLLVPRSGRTL
jgi:hypothetical protein